MYSAKPLRINNHWEVEYVEHNPYRRSTFGLLQSKEDAELVIEITSHNYMTKYDNKAVEIIKTCQEVANMIFDKKTHDEIRMEFALERLGI